MEYEMQQNMYTLGEFYTLYKDKLPTVVMVTQGFSGDRLEETFDYGQVIRIHSVFRQQRVIAVRLDERGNEECTYSFPVHYPIHFCLCEMLYQNESLTLAEILDKCDLPVDVKFARKQFIKIGDNTCSTSRLFNLRLTNVFDEICLLGNFIFDGDLDLQIVQIPLYLSAMKFSEVTGLKFKGNSDWKALLRKLDGKACQLNFDAFSGNNEIARYKPNSLSRLVCSERKNNALIYENFYPEMYTNITELVEVDPPSQSKAANAVDDGLYEPLVTSSAGKNTIKTADEKKSTHNTNQSKTKCSHDVRLYTPLVMAPAGNTNCKTNDTNPNQKQKSTHNKDHGKSLTVQKQLVCELTDRFQKGFVSLKCANSSDKPSIISPKPKLNRHASEPLFTGQQPAEVVPSEVVPCFRPSTPTRLPASSQSKLYRNKSLSTSFETYENVKISIAELHPSTYVRPCATSCEQNTVRDEQFKSEPSKPQRIEGGADTKTVNVEKLKVGEQGRSMAEPLCNPQRIEGGDDTKTINVGKLKVGELGRWMADKLRLGRHVARFAEELVDGAILVDLNENLLKEEFGFSPMEAKRLMKFAKEGHIPQ